MAELADLAISLAFCGAIAVALTRSRNAMTLAVFMILTVVCTGGALITVHG